MRSPQNPNHWWGNFLLLDQVPGPEMSQAWLDRFAAAFPAAEHVALGFDTRSGRLEDLHWYTSRGFEGVLDTVMTATALHEPATVNRDAVYRPLRSDEDWAQSLALRIRCRDRALEPVGFRAFAAARGRAFRRIVEAGHGAWYGAFVAGELRAQMGLVAAGGGAARYQAVETDPDFRRRGLAGTLVYQVGQYGFATLGAQTLVIVADPGYFAIDLYRSVGFQDTETQLQIERPPPRG